MLFSVAIHHLLIPFEVHAIPRSTCSISADRSALAYVTTAAGIAGSNTCREVVIRRHRILRRHATGALKSSKGNGTKQSAAVAYKKVALTADVSLYILHAYLRDSALELPEHAA